MMKATFLVLFVLINMQLCSGELFSNIWIRKKKEIPKDTLISNIQGKGFDLFFDVIAGSGHNNPSFAIWLEDTDGNFIRELFVTKSVATGIFRYGDTSSGEWTAGERRYRAALPYFFHKRSPDAQTAIVPDPKSPVADAFTGATPRKNFHLKTNTGTKEISKFRILLEVNQTWDFNSFWHNAKFPDNKDYRSSAQPSLIYAVTVDVNNIMPEYFLNPIGHGHYSGNTGNLYTDLSTFTTALEIFEKISVSLK